MSKLFAKLQHKGQVVYLLNAPESIEPFLAELEGVEIRRSCAKKERIDFSLSFAITQAELDKLSRLVIAAASDDATLWFAYPKGSSQRYQCEFNRDSGWTVLAEAGYEPVRMVAIDTDWSALRFRKVDKIRSFQRDAKHAISREGKKRANAKPWMPPKKP